MGRAGRGGRVAQGQGSERVEARGFEAPWGTTRSGDGGERERGRDEGIRGREGVQSGPVSRVPGGLPDTRITCGPIVVFGAPSNQIHRKAVMKITAASARLQIAPGELQGLVLCPFFPSVTTAPSKESNPAEATQ